MIICPNCNHQNPDGSTQCENCYTPLPQTTTCPNCGASVQTDATFCGQCGFNLQVEMIEPVMEMAGDMAEDMAEDMADNLEVYPELTYTEATETLQPVAQETPSSGLQSPWDQDEDNPMTTPQEKMPWQEEDIEEKEPEPSEFVVHNPWDAEESEQDLEEIPELSESEELLDLVNSMESLTFSDSTKNESAGELFSSPPSLPEEPQELAKQEEIEVPFSLPAPETKKVAQPQPFTPPMSGVSSATQLQLQTAKLLHVQTNNIIEIPPSLAVIHIGKPNSQIPPDIDVSGFANSDVVSRIHADIRVEGDAYFIEDVGSSNGTYINHIPLLVGNRHRLRTGDRIALGKGDLVTFIFQISE
ncbi:MAG: FHA domain-containing protein [Xenococcaceae cyanobacterium]